MGLGGQKPQYYNSLENIAETDWAKLLDACGGAYATVEEADCLDYNFSTLFYAFLTFM